MRAVCPPEVLRLADVERAVPKEDEVLVGTTYSVIFDAAGKHSFRRCRR